MGGGGSYQLRRKRRNGGARLTKRVPLGVGGIVDPMDMGPYFEKGEDVEDEGGASTFQLCIYRTCLPKVYRMAKK